MDARSVVSKIEPVLRRRLRSFEIRILKDKLPHGVEFLVTSVDFEGMDRGDRIRFMADVVAETFHLPLTFSPAGLALTPAEANELKPWDDKEDDFTDWSGLRGEDGTAALP